MSKARHNTTSFLADDNLSLFDEGNKLRLKAVYFFLKPGQISGRLGYRTCSSRLFERARGS
jgi:hypothetical protein